jgi:hypothetical protein
MSAIPAIPFPQFVPIIRARYQALAISSGERSIMVRQEPSSPIA